MFTSALLAAASATAAFGVSYDYYDVGTSAGLHGSPFPPSRKQSPFDRFPSTAKGVVRDAVWDLSKDSAGLFFMFETNASSFVSNITYLYSDTTMWHFPSTGVAGMDLYL